MTLKEKLLKEFECAINSVYGDVAEYDIEDVNIEESDIEAIAHKVKFYLFD